MWLRTHIICCILFLGALNAYTQETKEDIEKQAEKHFRKEQFLEATPLYLRLLSLEQSNPNYNYKYGTCLLYNSSEKKDAFKYLNFAVSRGAEVDDEAYYYLAKAYHLTYQFNKAIQYYQKYKSKAGNNISSTLEVDRQIQMCENGKSLLDKVDETVVLDKREIDIESFFRIYDLNNIGGELIVTEEFQSKQDQKNNHTPLIHFPANSKRIFYSTYSDSKDHKDIVMRTKMTDGRWSEEQQLFGDVNTKYDEDFPYMHPTGKYLYFSSKGHNSMGGYDIFRSPYDEESNTFGKPENLDITISSPDNDFLYIVDSLDKFAYFASQRETEMDKVNVYNVRVERFPIQMVVLKGEFSSTLNPNNKKLSIVVYNSSGEEMGSFKTDRNGNYIINLPKGGKYDFVLNVDNKDDKFKQTIELPYLKEFRPLKQEIVETKKEGEEVVLIKNLFDEEFDDPIAVMAEVLEHKSKMNINKNDFDLDSLDQVREQRKLLAKVGLENFSNYEIKGLIDSKVKDLSKRLESSTEKIAKAKKTVQNSTGIIEDALKKSDSLMNLSEQTTDDEDKKRFIRLANQELQKVKYTEDKAKNAMVLLEFLESDLVKNKELVNQAKNLNDDLDQVDTDDDEVFLKTLNKHKSFVEDELKESTNIDAQFEFLSQIEDQLKELEEQEIRKKQLEQQKSEAEKEIERLKNEVANAKRKKKEALEMELSSKENQLSDINNEIDYTDKKLEKGKELRAQKDIVEEVNNTSVNENEDFASTNDLKNQFTDQSEDLKTKSLENENAVAENDVDISNDSENDKSTNETNPNKNNTTEVSESEKQTILDEVDDNYSEEIQQLENDYENGKTSIDKVIDRKSEHRESLEKALDETKEDIAENGADDENSKRQEVLENEISTIDNQIAELEQTKSATADSNENDVTAISESEKQAILDKVDDNYSEEIEQLENDYENGKTSIDKVIDRKSEHRESLEKALDETKEDIAGNGEDDENSKRQEVLENEISTIDNQIAELEQTKTVTADSNENETTAVSKSEKQTILDEVDDNYSEEIQQLENDYENGKTSIDKVIDRKSEHRESLEKALDETKEDIAENGEDDENSKREEVLENEISSINNQITELEQTKTATADSNENDATETSESEKQTILDEVDDNYSEEIQQLENDYENGKTSIDKVIDRKSEHRESLEKALDETKEDITENGADDENSKRQEVLENEISTIDNQIAELEQTKSATADSNENDVTAISESEKQTILDEVDDNYSEEIQQLENDYENGKASIDKVIDRKSKHRESLEKALDETKEDIAKNGADDENSKRQEVLENEISTIDNQIAELEQTKTATADSNENDATESSESEKQTILDEVDDNYSEEIEQLENDYENGKASIDKVIDRKSKHRESLEKALDETKEDIAENGEDDENSKREEVLENEISSIDNQIAELEQTKTATADSKENDATAVSESEKQAILDEVDDNYSIEIGDLSEDFVNNNVDKSKVIKRQQKYLDEIEKAINDSENTSDNKKKQAILNDEKQRVQIEIEELEQASDIDKETINRNKNEAIQASNLSEKENEALTSSKNSDLNTLKQKEKALDKVQKTLVESISKSNSIVEKRDLNSTLNEIRKESRQVKIQIGDLSQNDNKDDISNNNEKISNELDDKQKSSIEKNKGKIEEYKDERASLEESIIETDDIKEQEKLEDKLNKIDEKIAKEEVEILEKTTEVGESIGQKEINQLQNEEESSLALIEAEKELIEARELQKRAKNTKDPVKKAELLKKAKEKQSQAIEKSEEEQAQRDAKILIGDISSSKKLNTIDPENVSETANDIEEEQINIGVKLMEIDDQLKRIDALMPSLKRREAGVLENQKRDLLEIQTKLLNKKQKNKDRLNQIDIQKKKNANKGVEEKAIENDLSYLEELEIAQTEEYKEVSRAVNTLEQKQYELKVKEENLIHEKTNLKKQLESVSSKGNPTHEEKEKIGETLTNIDKTNNEITVLKEEIGEQQENIRVRLPENAEKREQMENMIARNVDPVVAPPTLPTIATGLVLLDNNKKKYSEDNPIPLETKKPKGLVFRVQIGAFSKPVPNETFNDFSPVSGEEVRPGLIRYMAGYFGGRRDATDARNQIRTMGYNDAFVVAYCDGERIPIYRAEELLASGACVPSIETSEKPILTADETTSSGGGDSFEKEIDKFAYNKAPGAAEADVAENKMGLYYTVQVGVYNKPASSEQLKNITPLITKRLPNGQMRYSSGVFDNLNDANGKKSEAVNLGITDAFVVAYYQGERITVSQAQELIKENGEQIFESQTPTVVKRNKVERKQNAPEPKAEKFFKNKSYQVQFISKSKYESYPTQVLQRYNNSDAKFYYDSLTGHIKSSLYEMDEVPNLPEIKDEFDVENFYKGYAIKNLDAFTSSEAVNTEDIVNQLTATVLSRDLNDDLIQSIINSPLLKKIETTERGVKAVFYEKNGENGINELQIKLARFGATLLKKSIVNIGQNN